MMPSMQLSLTILKISLINVGEIGCMQHEKYNKHVFFISNTFASNARLRFAKNKAKAKQHPENELFLFEYRSLSSSTLSLKIIRNILKIYRKQVRSV